MSHIFEALQRAEAERSGNEVAAVDLPIDLLRVAESDVAAQIKSTKTEVPASTPGSVFSPTEPRAAEVNESGLLREFQPLPVSLVPDGKLVSVTAQESLAAEKFRYLAVRLRHLQQRRQLKQLLVTSTMPEEGKSMIAANLACSLANRKQKKTVLVEGDLRCPTVQHQFGLGKILGLSEYLQGTNGGELPLYRLDALGIWVLPAGKSPANPLELLQSGRLAPLMHQLSRWFDWIIIDSPPVLPLGDTSVWARLADGILLVVRQGTTDKEQLKRGLETIETNKLIGALVNCSTNTRNGHYYYRYSSAIAKPDHAPPDSQL